MYKNLTNSQEKKFAKKQPLLKDFNNNFGYTLNNVLFERSDLISILKNEQSVEKLKQITNDYWNKSEEWVQCFILGTRRNFLNGKQKVTTLVIEFDHEFHQGVANICELSVKFKNGNAEKIAILQDNGNQYKYFSELILKAVEMVKKKLNIE